ncbi:DNA mismatch repair protein, MutS family, putative [Theileria annulata]|uniref:DNA mismatch repair protein n=1 Tax=Theileria annulata TaxID=5874 RepID=Q4UGD4_THEAN|nr:DNA mismatch repair protein, MutS family, putative [Theileria annulata]CAI73855.1 DNA mismatch repair protein, MutS family, putative [Theileria annulata]|eukprot:XP_954532.1 DNA mismatch repair protein, MutS family, putative [Theileria annulata]
MSQSRTAADKNVSITSFFRPVAKTEIKEELEGTMMEYEDEDNDSEQPERVLEQLKPVETPVNKESVNVSLLSEHFVKIDTTRSDSNLTSTHYEESTVSIGELEEEDIPLNRKRTLLFDDSNLHPKLKNLDNDNTNTTAGGGTSIDTYTDSNATENTAYNSTSTVSTVDTANNRERVENVKRELMDDERLIDRLLYVYEFDDKKPVDMENVTVGKEDKRHKEDTVDFNERELYLGCKASENSLGFRSYVENYYRYKGTFSFPPWLEPRNLKDAEGRRPLAEGYDTTTLWIPPRGHRWAYEFRSGHYTECMQQWWEVKKTHFDSLVFFKMGKFYELFYQDACVVQGLTGLRWMGAETKPHVGFPEKSIHFYASACVNAGHRVVVVEQTETPQQLDKRNKALGTSARAVKRDVCDIITPGTVSAPEMLTTQSRPLLIMSLTQSQPESQTQSQVSTAPESEPSISDGNAIVSIVCLDVSMSKIRFGTVKYTDDLLQVKTVLIHFCPAEVVLDSVLFNKKDLIKAIKALPYSAEITSHISQNKSRNLLNRVKDRWEAVANECSTALLLTESYLTVVLLDKIVEYCYFEPFNFAQLEVMSMDYSALVHLELFVTQEGTEKNSLFHYLNHTKTAFGERLLRYWLLNPLTDVDSINLRSEAVEFLVQNYPLVTTLNQELERFPDLERALGKILNSASNYHKRAIYFDRGVYTKLYDLYTLFDKFQKLEDIILNFLNESINLFSSHRSEFIRKVEEEFLRCSDDVIMFKSMLKLTGEKSCASVEWPKSKELRAEIQAVEAKLDRVLENIRQISPSACFVHCKFRYEVEMTESEFQRYQRKSGVHASPSSTAPNTADNTPVCKQPVNSPANVVGGVSSMEITSTRSGFVRGRNVKIVQILEELEEVEFKLKESEEEFYQEIVSKFHSNSFKFCKLIEIAAQFDCLTSLATVAKNSPFPMSRPKILPKSYNTLRVKDSVYPIFNISNNKFIPNSVNIGEGLDGPILIITGPNMGGKSTLLRQIALTIIMGQIGSFVSSVECEFSIADSIFTRLGASDNILQGKSTFLVELQDISSILSKATSSSLALIDELGRGTSTFDGTAIAVATLEKISKIGCRCVFTTHFQDVCVFAETLSNVSMFHMAAKVDEETRSVEFLYKLVPGVCPDSHGMHVAKLARIPDHIIQNAKKARVRLFNNYTSGEVKESNKLLEKLTDEILEAHYNNDNNSSVFGHNCMELDYEEDIRKSLEKYFNGIGYKIADGTNFGSDLVIYTKPGPNLSHSKYFFIISFK